MANLGQHIWAFFDPSVAVNEDGYLVEADGFFDSGNGSDDYLNQDELSDVRSFFYEKRDGSPEGFYSPSDSSSFAGADYADELIGQINDAVEGQNSAAQSSADRAMEFEEEQAQLNRDFQAAQAQKAMDYQTYMSNTAYQRAMADLKAAGINPKMVAQLGGASTPSGVSGSGAQASGHAASMSMANTSALAGLLETYITSANSLDRQNNGFVQNILRDILYLSAYVK